MISPLRFAHFEVLTRSDGSPYVLGQGAMGMTYKALDQTLLSLAVIKVPTGEYQNLPEARQRFLQEAQVMARLRHPHVASVFFYGDSPTGAFYAMEFCDGPSLQEYVMRNGPLSYEQTFQIALQAAAALQALDAHELIHRDLKPSNILLTTNAQTGVNIKLIDFGVAREGLPTEQGGISQSGFVGTPAYASPEQLLESSNLDTRSDIYSLGAVLWFCLTGRPPFEGSQFEVMFHHVNTEPDWDFLPPLPGEGLTVLKRLLAKSAEERYATPALLLSTLQKLLGTAPATSAIHLQAESLTPYHKNLGGYDLLEELPGDSYGQVWRAQDNLTGRTIALRILPPELASKQSVMLRLMRLVSFVRALEHHRWQQVWHIDQQGTECRIALELVEGPTVLHLLKVRRHLPLQEVLPLLAQVAEALDFAANQGLSAMETAPERIPIDIHGWGGMSESQRAAMLRFPLSQWPEWSVKVCPLRFSSSAQDYVLPTDGEAAQAFSRLGADYLHLCHQLLTGQGRGAGDYVPSPLLQPEGNEYFERYFSSSKAHRRSCSELLQILCRAEAPQLLSASSSRAQVDPFETQATSTVRYGSPLGIAPGSALGSTAFRTTAPMAAPSLESRRVQAQAQAEADQLKADEKLQAEKAWLEQEREALEKARQEVAAQEEARLQREAEEQRLLVEQQRLLEEQQAQLEQKRREQLQLEQEIQARAQQDFQRLQEEARARETQRQQQRESLEQALRAREADFQLRERERLERLEALKQEAAQLEVRVHQEYLTVRQAKEEQSLRNVADQVMVEQAQEMLAAQEQRLNELHDDLDDRLQDWKGTRTKKLTLVAAVLSGLIFLAGLATYLYRNDYLSMIFPAGGSTWSAATTNRQTALAEGRWVDVLHQAAQTLRTFQQDTKLSSALAKRQTELATDITQAVQQLVERPFPNLQRDQATQLRSAIETLKAFIPDETQQVILTKARIQEAIHQGHEAAALAAYQQTVETYSKSASSLTTDLSAIIQSLQSRLASGQTLLWKPLIAALEETQKWIPSSELPPLRLITQQLKSANALEDGQAIQSLQIALTASEANASQATLLKPQAQGALHALKKLPLSELAPFAKDLHKAALVWNLPEAFFLLAKMEPQGATQLQYYAEAEKRGDMTARALAGKLMVDSGVASLKTASTDEAKSAAQKRISDGVAKIQESAQAEDMEGIKNLGEAYYAGVGVSQNYSRALALAQEATVKGHPEAFFLEGRAWLRLGEQAKREGDRSTESDCYNRAKELLKQALVKQIPGSPYPCYQAFFEGPSRDRKMAAAALEKGVAERDPDSLYMLGLWKWGGLEGYPRDVAQGMHLIQEAANLGQPTAVEWRRNQQR